MDELTIEFYRTLKAENAAYQDKLQALWLTKFTLCGALAGFIIINEAKLGIFGHVSPGMPGVGLVVVLAIAIDCKVLEYGLHVRAISSFIGRTFGDDPRVVAWEAVLWGQAGQPERPMVLGRSVLTIVSAAMPTLAIVCAATAMFVMQGYERIIYPAGAIVAAYAAIVIAASLAFFKARKPLS